MTTTPVSSVISNLPLAGVLTGAEPVPIDYGLNGPTQHTTTGAIAALAMKLPWNQVATGQFYADNGAVVNRHNDRDFFGAATVNDGNFPNNNADYLSAFQVGVGDSPSIESAQVAVLAAVNSQAAFAFVAGAQTLPFTSAGTFGIAGSFFMLNNGAHGNDAEGIYVEAHHISASANFTAAAELEVRTTFGAVTPTPNIEGNVVVLQLGAGAGVSLAGQQNISAFIQMVAAPTAAKVGINIMNGAIAAGGNAIELPSNAPILFVNVGGHAAGRIVSTAAASNDYGLIFGDNGLEVTGNSNATAIGFFQTIGLAAVNWINILNAATGSGPAINAAGGDASVSLNLGAQGASGKILLNAASAVTGDLSATGNMNIATGKSYEINAVPLLTGQAAGYGTPTGGSHQASFAAGAITLPNLAAAVAQLIVDLKAGSMPAT